MARNEKRSGIGSKTKVKQVLVELEPAGIPANTLSTIYSPVGIDIAAETPAEIAISILAEIIQVRRTGSESPISLKLDPFIETVT